MAVVLYDHRGELIEEAPVGPIDWKDAYIDLMQESNVQMQERLLSLDVDLENLGWERISGGYGYGLGMGGVQLSRQFLRNAMALAQIMYLKNPLINRAVEVQKAYVWGQGISISADDDRVNEVIQEFVDDRRNRAELTSQQAYEGKEEALQTTGNLFFVFFPNPSTGMVRVRTIPPDEIEDIICDPEDAKTPRFYKRVWSRPTFDPSTGISAPKQETVYYPDWHLRPTKDMPTIPTEIGGKPVENDTPIYHVKVGGLSGQKFGMPEVYAALDWARAAKEHLEDWASVWRALNQFAWSLKTTHGSRSVAAAKAKLGTTVGNGHVLDTNPPALPGSTFISTEGVDMQPMQTRGARPSPEEAHYLWLMVASACGLPEIFFGNADVGNHATAKTLDRPTELRMTARQTLWVDVLGAIIDYVVMWAVRAPDGLLNDYAQIVQNRNKDDELIEWGEDTDPHIEVKFPDLLEHDVAARINAIVTAATLNGHPAIALPMRRVVEMMLGALGVDDIDEEILAMFPGDNEGDMGQSAGDEGTPNPEGGQGAAVDPAVQQAAEALMTALEAAGVVDPRKKRPLPDEEDGDEEDQPVATTGDRKRDRSLLPIAVSLATNLQSRTDNPASMENRTRTAVKRAYRSAYETGLQHGNPEHIWSADDTAYVDQAVEGQMDYLRGFASAIRAGDLSDAQLTARAGLYGAPLAGAYSRGLVTGGKESGVESWTWNTQGDDACCDNCAPRAGETYTADNLPGFPGEGDFGSDLCLGGPQCRCWLEPVEGE